MRIKLEDGKYEVELDHATGKMTFYRNGEPWTAAQQDWQHAKFIYCTVSRIAELEEALRTIAYGTPLDAQLNRNNDGLEDFIKFNPDSELGARVNQWYNVGFAAVTRRDPK